MVPERKGDGNLGKTERSMLRVICGVQLKDRKRAKSFVLMLALKETIDELSMANSVR